MVTLGIPCPPPPGDANTMDIARRSIAFGACRLLLAFAWPAGAGAATPAAKPSNFQRFADVKTWRLRVTWTLSGHTEKVVDFTGGDREVDTWSASLGGQVDYKLVRAGEEMDPDIGFRWKTDDVPPTGNFDMTAESKSITRRRDGTSTSSLQHASAAGVRGGSARVSVERRTQQFRLTAYLRTGPGEIEMTSDPGGSGRMPAPVLVLGLDDGNPLGPHDWTGPLPTDTTDLIIRDEPKPIACTAPVAVDGKRTVEVSWTLTPWEKEPPGDVHFTVMNLEQWEPDPKEPLHVTVSWKGRADEVRSTLSGVSRLPGTCLNSPSADVDNDLDLPAQGEWLFERKEGEVVGTLVLRPDAPSTAELEVDATDYGGWAGWAWR